MASGFRKFHLLLLHLLVLQEMMAMLSEAALCEAPSRLFKGGCFSSHNCGTICETEGFANGRCKFFKCICSKDCNANGGGGSGGGGGGGGGGGDDGSGGGGGGDEPPSEGPPDGGDSPPDGGDSPPDGGEGPPDEGSPPPAAIKKNAYFNRNV